MRRVLYRLNSTVPCINRGTVTNTTTRHSYRIY